MMTTVAPTIHLETAGRVARLTIDNPARRNAMTLEMWQRLADLVSDAANNPDTRVVVLTGAGERAFCAGADISQFSENRRGGLAAAYDTAVACAQAALASAAKPTVAIVRGACHGGGVGLALCCDIRLASPDAHFRIPAARLGLGYALPNVELVVHHLGLSSAADLLFSARRVDATEALRMGIATKLLSADNPVADAEAYVETIAKNAPLTLLGVKAALVELAKPETKRDEARVHALVAACMASADYAEGQAAFRDKRDPEFNGT